MKVLLAVEDSQSLNSAPGRISFITLVSVERTVSHCLDKHLQLLLKVSAHTPETQTTNCEKLRQ